MKRITSVIPIVVLTLGIATLIFFNIQCSEGDRIKEIKEDEKVSEKKKVLTEMAARYDAVTDWTDRLNESDTLFGAIFTIDIQEALLQQGGRPIVFYSALDDVWEYGGKYFARFTMVLGWQPVYFDLECNLEQSERLRHNKQRYLSRLISVFVVVAQIDDVQKTKFKVTAYPQGTGEDSWAEVEIETSGLFIATGKCLDFRYVE